MERAETITSKYFFTLKNMRGIKVIDEFCDEDGEQLVLWYNTYIKKFQVASYDPILKECSLFTFKDKESAEKYYYPYARMLRNWRH